MITISKGDYKCNRKLRFKCCRLIPIPLEIPATEKFSQLLKIYSIDLSIIVFSYFLNVSKKWLQQAGESFCFR